MKNLRQPAVGAFLTAASQKIGGTQDKLAIWLSFEGYSVQRSTVSRWVTGTNDPPSWVLFHIAAELRISLDEFAIGLPRDQSLAERMTALEFQVAEMRRLLAFREPPAPPSRDE